MLNGKKILLGITGSIAAYKSAFLVRQLVRDGAEVKVIMTPSAHDFITPLTLSTLSRNPVLTQFADIHSGQWNSHVELGLWADVFIIAPASANSIAKCASGICDNLLLATYLSARCPVMIAPAMDLDMYNHHSTRTNLSKLESYSNIIIPADTGELASGLTGIGRMAEPGKIVEIIREFLIKQNSLSGKTVLVTAGPTRESIDPVRFIGNHSTGKMGIAIACELANRGALVKLVLGPAEYSPSVSKIEVSRVNSAVEMLEISKMLFPSCQVAIFSAAVADYRPANPSAQKIKKREETLHLDLIRNPDIAFELGKNKAAGQVTVGFALESTNAFENAKEKLRTKYFDFIVVNSLEDEGAGFAFDTNKISIIDKSGSQTDFPLKSKGEVAKDIVNYLTRLL